MYVSISRKSIYLLLVWIFHFHKTVFIKGIFKQLIKEMILTGDQTIFDTVVERTQAVVFTYLYVGSSGNIIILYMYIDLFKGGISLLV